MGSVGLVAVAEAGLAQAQSQVTARTTKQREGAIHPKCHGGRGPYRCNLGDDVKFLCETRQLLYKHKDKNAF